MSMIQKAFGLRVTAAVTGAAALALAAGLSSGDALSATFNDTSDSCIRAGRTTSFDSPERQDLRRIMEISRRSEAGSAIVSGLGEKHTLVCYDESLNEPDSCGAVTVGWISFGENRIFLNPEYPEKRLSATLVHEARHKRQEIIGLDWYRDANIREEERIILKWITEADARVSSIIFAFEMNLNGQPDYLEKLRNDNWYSHMVRAFEDSLATGHGDVTQAMRAAFLAFRDNSALASHYDNNTIDWIEQKAERAFNPAKPAETVLTDDLLREMGEMPPYGNYINQDTIKSIKDSFTAGDYQNLVLKRKQAGPKPVC